MKREYKKGQIYTNGDIKVIIINPLQTHMVVSWNGDRQIVKRSQLKEFKLGY